MVLLEVETKVRIDNVNALRKKIQKIATFKKKESRSDDYFAIRRKFRKSAYPKKAFRIRDNGKEFVVNFKKWLTSYWDKQIVIKQEMIGCPLFWHPIIRFISTITRQY